MHYRGKCYSIFKLDRVALLSSTSNRQHPTALYFAMESCNNSDTSTTDNTSDISNDTVICHGDNLFNRVVFQVPTIIYISVIIQIILIIAIFFCNSLVIVLVVQFRHLHSISNFFIACLSGADIGLSLAMIPGVVITFNPLFGASKLKCLLLWCSIIFTSSTSCLTLLVVTFDRFLHIMRPDLYPVLMNRKRAVHIISIVWAYTFLYAVVLPVAGVNQIYRKNFLSVLNSAKCSVLRICTITYASMECCLSLSCVLCMVLYSK